MRSTGVRRLVLVDGVFAPSLSETGNLEKGLGIRTLREVLEAGDATLHAQLFAPENSDTMVALNSAMMTDGLVIEVADGVALTQPLHIVHIASGGVPAAMFTRSLLRLGKAASATLVESYIAADGAKAYQVHDSLIVSIGDEARLDHVRLIEDSREAFNISSAVGDAGRKRPFQHVRHDQRIECQPLSGDDRLCRRGLAGRDQRRQPAQRPPACRYHAVSGSRGAELREPRDLPRRGRRPRPFGVPGPHHRSPEARRRPTPR